MPIKEFIDNTPHSKIGASSMYRWKACPGSVQLSKFSTKPSSSPHAILGTIAHEVAAFYLTKGFWPLPDTFGLTISELDIMVKAVSVYTDYIKRIKDTEPGNKFHVEHTFNMESVYPGAFGTADFVSYNPDSKHLKVIDYKHGKGLVVEVENNLQLLYYALGAIVTLNYPFQAVELLVVQPRAFHPKGVVRNWIIGIEEILDFKATLIEAAKLTEGKDPKFEAGEHCFFCPAIELCPKKTAAKAAKRAKVMKPLFNDPRKDFAPVDKEGKEV